MKQNMHKEKPRLFRAEAFTRYPEWGHLGLVVTPFRQNHLSCGTRRLLQLRQR